MFNTVIRLGIIYCNNVIRLVTYFERSAEKCGLMKIFGVPSNQTLKKQGILNYFVYLMKKLIITMGIAKGALGLLVTISTSFLLFAAAHFAKFAKRSYYG